MTQYRGRRQEEKIFKCQRSGLIRIPLWFLSKPFQNSNEEPFIWGRTICGECFLSHLFFILSISLYSFFLNIQFPFIHDYSWIWGSWKSVCLYILSPLIISYKPIKSPYSGKFEGYMRITLLGWEVLENHDDLVYLTKTSVIPLSSAS